MESAKQTLVSQKVTVANASNSGGEDNLNQRIKVEDGMEEEDDIRKTLRKFADSERRFVSELLHSAFADRVYTEEKQACDQKLVSRSSAPANQGQSREGKVWLSRSQYKKLKKRRAESKAAPDQRPSISTSSEVETTIDKDSHNLKRQRDDPEEVSSQVVAKQKKHGPRSSAKEFSKLAVTIHRGDGVSLNKIDAKIIRKRLADHIQAAVQANVDGRKLAFATSGLVLQGFFLVTPMTEEARCWILSLDLGRIKETPLIISPLPREKVSIWLPGCEDEIPKDPLKLLVGQNNYKVHLRVSEWFLMHKESLPMGTRLVVGVPPKVIKGEVWLNFQATQVLASLIKSSSKMKTPNKEIEIDSSEYNTIGECDQTGSSNAVPDGSTKLGSHTDQYPQPTTSQSIVKEELLDRPDFDSGEYDHQTGSSNAASDGSTDTKLSSHTDQYQQPTTSQTIVKEELLDRPNFDSGEYDHQTGSSNAGPEGSTDMKLSAYADQCPLLQKTTPQTIVKEELA